MSVGEKKANEKLASYAANKHTYGDYFSMTSSKEASLMIFIAFHFNFKK